MEATWAAVITKPLAEEAAAKALRSRGWRVYLPRYRKILRGVRLDGEGRRHRTRGFGEVVLRPLFPRYLFMELAGGGWSGVAHLPGVLALVGGVVGSHWRPYLIGEETVELIRAAERSGEFDEAREDGVRQDLALGTQVRVAEIGDMVAELVSLDEDGRARVLIEILGRGVETSVSANGLLAVG